MPVSTTCCGLRDIRRWERVERDDLMRMIASSAKRRYVIDGDRIRSLYGHSVPGRIDIVRADPPEVLFHGTSPTAWASIQKQGLMPMGRQYVHLSNRCRDGGAAARVKADAPIVLHLLAGEAGRREDAVLAGQRMDLADQGAGGVPHGF